MSKAGAFWRRNVGTIAFVSLIALSTAGFVRVEHEGYIREQQFCTLVWKDIEDQNTQLIRTKQFLHDPPPELQNFSGYVKTIGLPQLENDIRLAEGRVPPICTKYEPAVLKTNPEGS